jgi:hypothetical protein
MICWFHLQFNSILCIGSIIRDSLPEATGYYIHGRSCDLITETCNEIFWTNNNVHLIDCHLMQTYTLREVLFFFCVCETVFHVQVSCRVYFHCQSKSLEYISKKTVSC